MRGAYASPQGNEATGIGSSPHAWGLRTDSPRYTPRIPVHPHMRGAYALAAVPALFQGRFIPTCVGLTVVEQGKPDLAAVHPHMRGAYYWCSYLQTNMSRFIPTSPHAWGLRIESKVMPASGSGSSPHAWGLRAVKTNAILADIGSSPHAWGLLLVNDISEARKYGSSPHAWGLLFHRSHAVRA